MARWLLLLGVVHIASAVSLRQDAQDRGVYRFDNPHFTIEVDASAGGRIRSWKLKPAGRDLIALWKGATEIGGALDDRAVFTTAAMDAAIMQPGPNQAVLRLEARDPSGFELLKILTVTDEPTVRVSYEFRNGTQATQRLMIRNFFLPGGGPQTEQHRYSINGPEGKSVADDPRATGYFAAGSPPFAALRDTASGDGILAVVPGAEQFYIWRGSREFPTFEWLYPELPAGRIWSSEVCFRTVTRPEPVEWHKLATLAPGAAPVTRALAGWVDEASRFGVTAAERERGFWLSTGEDAGKQRLPSPLRVDLPAGQTRHIPITLNLLRDQTAPVRLICPTDAPLAVFRDTPAADRRELLPLPAEPLELKAGSSETLWLRIGPLSGPVSPTLSLTVGGASLPLELALHGWPVELPDERPFHVRGYSGGFPVWSGYDLTEAGLARLETLLTAFADMGGDVIDWTVAWHRVLAHVRLRDGGELLTSVAKEHPERLELERLPALDFSYYDPAIALAKKHGVTRIETHMEDPKAERWQWSLLDPALGKGRVKAGSPEAERVLVWLYQELRRYFESHELTGFFCKISDEIAPEEIPRHIATAELVRAAGWRPFTTITGLIARTAELIEAMDPYCDEWQLAFSLKDDFLRLRDERYRVIEQRFAVPGEWGSYGNGGAEQTYAQRLFGEGSATALSAGQIETFELLEDGRALAHRGGSAWGNRERGVVISGGSLRSHLWMSPTTGSPHDHRYELVVRVRQIDPNGQPLVQLDKEDEVWCYGGGSSPFRAGFRTGYAYPLMTLYHAFDGFGQWAFYHWNATERVVWVDDHNHLTVSPVYCGYRDGWHDARLFAQVRARLGESAFGALAGPAAPLRVDWLSQEVYRYKTVTNAGDPVAINEARRQALAALAAP